MTRRLALAALVFVLSVFAALPQFSTSYASSPTVSRQSRISVAAARAQAKKAADRHRVEAARARKAAAARAAREKAAALARKRLAAIAASAGELAGLSPVHLPQTPTGGASFAPPAPAPAPVSVPVLAPPTTVASSRPAPSPSDKPTADPPPAAAPPASKPAPAAQAPVQTNRVTRQGSQLSLNGSPFTFTGVNAFGAATDYSTNAGCGGPVDLQSLFSELAPHGVLRFWAFEDMAWNPNTQKIDFTGIDRVVSAANASGRKLVMTLSDQAGTCDDGRWHDQSWYDGGYADANASGSHGMSYLGWVNLIVARYAGNPAIAFWEPVNEPEASTCTGGATGSACYGATRTCADSGEYSLRNFFDAVGSDIKRLDPTGLVSTGFVGDKQCGVNGGGFDRIAASQYVDLLTYHDYSGDNETMPPDLAGRIRQAAADGKPLAIEEAGIDAGSSCLAVSDRASDFQAKADAQLGHGIVGYLPWTVQGANDTCGYSISLTDPVFAVLRALGS